MGRVRKGHGRTVSGKGRRGAGRRKGFFCIFVAYSSNLIGRVKYNVFVLC